jgi:WXXGXW repeat (2 copies)
MDVKVRKANGPPKIPHKMNLNRILLIAVICGAAPLAARADIGLGINIGGPDIVVHSRPPAERIETVPMSPGPGYFWVRGHWGWRHEAWEWVPGRWNVNVAQTGQDWIPGQWVERNGGYVWIEGHFMVQNAPTILPTGANYDVVAPEPPPAPIYEAAPMAPGPDYFWIGGHWHWNHGWVWVHGRFDRHPHFHQGGGWEEGRWDRRGGNYVWVEGHWR